MKKIILTLSYLFAFYLACAQETTSTDSLKVIDQPVITIKGEDLQKFPSGDLMLALEGRIPGYDSFSQSQSNFLFIIDGIYSNNVNSISTSEIAEIKFYKGGLLGKDGIFSTTNGTFIIKTKRSNYGQPLTTTFLLQAGSNNESGNNSYFSQNYRIGVQKGHSIVKYSAGLNYSNNYYGGFLNADNYILNANLDVKPLNWLETGVHINYNPNNFKYLQGNYKGNIKQLNGDFYFTVNPVKGLTNTFTVAKNKYDSNTDFTYSGFNEYSNYSQSRSNNSIIFYNNKLNYEFGFFKNHLKVGANFTYNRIEQDYSNELKSNRIDEYIYEPSVAVSIQKIDRSVQSYMGGLSFNVNNWLILEGGFHIDEPSYTSAKHIKSPYGALTVDYKNILFKQSNLLSSGTVNFAFSKRSKLIADNVLSNTIGFSYNVFPIEPGPLDNKVFSLSASIGLLKNRVLINGDFTDNTSSTFFPYNTSVNTYPHEIKTKSWRLWINSEVIKTTDLSWNMGVNLSNQKNKLILSEGGQNTSPTGGIGIITTTGGDDDSYNKVLLGGLQQTVHFKKVSFEMNAAVCFNRNALVRSVYQVPVNNTYEMKNYQYFAINYMALGYSLGNVTKYVKNSSVYLVGRNLISTNENNLYTNIPKYIGLSLNVGL